MNLEYARQRTEEVIEMLSYGPKRRVMPRRTSAECAAAGRKGKAISHWGKAPHVRELHNFKRMKAWQSGKMLQEADEDE